MFPLFFVLSFYLLKDTFTFVPPSVLNPLLPLFSSIFICTCVCVKCVCVFCAFFSHPNIYFYFCSISLSFPFYFIPPINSPPLSNFLSISLVICISFFLFFLSYNLILFAFRIGISVIKEIIKIQSFYEVHLIVKNKRYKSIPNHFY